MVSRSPSTTKPSWLKVRAPGGERYVDIKHRLRRLSLNTVCEEAQCPNIGECWGGGTATIMLMGDICTRGCRFCAVTSGKPARLDPNEPENVANAIAEMQLDYVVLTSVNRDDLPDGGAEHYAQAVEAIKRRTPTILVEVLTPDFQGDPRAIARLCAAKPDVFAHNVETVQRLQRYVRDARATYGQSLGVLDMARKFAALSNHRMLTKTSVMVGCGEDASEVLETMLDLRRIDVDVITFGQYLRPTPKHLPVSRFVSPEDRKSVV